MGLLKSLGSEFIYGGHFTALTIVLFPVSISILIGVQLSWDWVIPVYLGCYGAYLFNRFKELKIEIKTNPKRSKYLMKRKKDFLFRIILSVTLLLAIPLISRDFLTFSFFVTLRI